MNLRPVRRGMSPFEIIVLGFALVTLLGALLLTLPLASQTHTWTSFGDALFTSISAVCVTGLIVHDTATYWSVFGQTVILILIEIGGLGVVSIVSFMTILTGKRISLLQRRTLQEAISAPQVGGVVKLTGRILKIALTVEAVGALIMLPVMFREYGTDGIWMSVFHSVSAFCNAGFDLMGSKSGPYTSLTFFQGNPIISLTIALLILVGGIGFLTWEDMGRYRHHLHRYRMQSKVILISSFFLVTVPSLLYFLVDFSDLPLMNRFCAAVFQAVTPRTAGFNTVDLTGMTSAGRALIMILMLVGGAPGSTAGGIKITTFAILVGNIITLFKGADTVSFFHRRVDADAVRRASTVLMIYLLLPALGALVISGVEGIDMEACLFETISAMCTVGLSLGLTPGLGMLSKLILMTLMFLGRVGSVTLILAAASHRTTIHSHYPAEVIMVG